jgi:hypothetical protein
VAISDLEPLLGHRPHEILFWSGAGISNDPPTSLPLGLALTRHVVETFCLPSTWGRLTALFRDFELRDGSGRNKIAPRLEAVLDTLVAEMGYEALDILAGCATASPNELHRLFAAHVVAGGTHVTTNFDTCIERSLQSGDRSSIHHIHGLYDGTAPGARELAARVGVVARGLPRATSDLLDRLLLDASLLVFVGYSGSDYFDVDPYFSTLSDRIDLGHLTVSWIHHRPSGTGGGASSADGSLLLRSLADSGALVRRHYGPTATVVARLLARDPPPTPKPVPPRFRAIPLSPDWDARVLATARLWASMGVSGEVVELFSQLRDVSSKPRDAQWYVSTALEDGGLYRKARRETRRLSRNDPNEVASRARRIAGSYWLQGRLLSALFVIRRAIQRAEREANVAEHTRLGLVDTAMHLLRDMGRLPFGAALTRRAVLAYWRRLSGAERIVADDPHLVLHARRLHQDIPCLMNEPIPSSWSLAEDALALRYQEIDSLFGRVNVDRRDLRNVLAAGGAVPVDAMKLLERRCRLLVDRAGIAKAVLIRRCYDNQPISWTAVRSVIEVQWTVARRIIWLVGYLRRRAPMGFR